MINESLHGSLRSNLFELALLLSRWLTVALGLGLVCFFHFA
jgi:hypothetical protein